jgi:hypothetical protein
VLKVKDFVILQTLDGDATIPHTSKFTVIKLCLL